MVFPLTNIWYDQYIILFAETSCYIGHVSFLTAVSHFRVGTSYKTPRNMLSLQKQLVLEHCHHGMHRCESNSGVAWGCDGCHTNTLVVTVMLVVKVAWGCHSCIWLCAYQYTSCDSNAGREGCMGLSWLCRVV